MKHTQAAEISERALMFLAARTPDIQRFLTISGLDVDELRQRAADPPILAAILGFVANDESLAKEFSESENLKPGELLRAMATLDPHGSTAW